MSLSTDQPFGTVLRVPTDILAQQTVLGIDIGGTFTDIVVRRPSGAFESTKVLTTSADPVAGVVAGISEILEPDEIAALDRISHATTLGINAIIERRGARVALVVTKGFEDVVEMGSGQRYELYDLTLRFPRPLVRSELRLGLDERLGPDGSVIKPLDKSALTTLAATIDETNPEAVAICLLHSYVNGEHEQVAADTVRGTATRPWTCISSEVVPEIREFPRIATTVANAYIGPRVGNYLTRLDEALRGAGFRGSFVTMLSNGGLSSAEVGARHPVRLLESGPVGGSVLAAGVARAHGRTRAVIFDMGGTTAKLSVLADGVLERTREFEVAREHRFRRGSGIPIQVPSVDVFEIGAGGGSIARIDAMRLVAVGPESASADPGPACYGRGGTRATVTDANLVLGYLSTEGFRTSGLDVDLEPARAAVAEQIADPLGMTLEEAAWAIHSAATDSMIAAARVHLAERGLDPASFALIALGGSGPVHAERVAQGIGVREVIVPPLPGVGSAAGLTMAPVAFDVARSLPCLVDDRSWPAIRGLYTELEEEARLLVSAVTDGPVSVARSADLQLVGQVHELEVPLPNVSLDELSPEGLAKTFAAVYTSRFHHPPLDRPLRGITWRLRVSAEEASSVLATTAHVLEGSTPAGRPRRVYLPRRGWHEATAYDRATLSPGFRGQGPALIEDRTTTVVLLSNAKFQVGDDLSIVVRLEG
jgi:N-methylhydantoinase A/oxoprolinase/acetone carboxylase beta subunit